MTVDPDFWNMRSCGLVCVALAIVWSPTLAAECPPEWDEPELQGTITDERLPEISGMISARDAQSFWVHNDSGYEPVIYRISSEGTVLQQVQIEGADSIDWEDLAWGECPGQSSSRCLFIGDFGDNTARRERVQIYVVEEPDIVAESAPVASTIEYVYEDGPRDAEAMIVDPLDGEIYVFEKSVSPQTGVYRVHDGVARRQATFETDEMFIYPNTITGADVSADGSFVVARTYLNLYVFCRGEGTLIEALNAPVASFATARRLIQPESLAIDPSGGLWSTTERLPARFYRQDISMGSDDSDMGGSDAGAQTDMSQTQEPLDAGESDAGRDMAMDEGGRVGASGASDASGCTTSQASDSRLGALLVVAFFLVGAVRLSDAVRRKR